ncbi:hypothetical protein [Oenococcus oeni]|uniref:hypothetical protein n=1 Tax=Oenococcus oeni TaxID=1247 RepID=UPI00214C4381|nr:hypothetical protein [Oenococcus oeni]
MIVLYLAFQVSLDPQGILKAKVFQGKVILYFALLTLSEIVLLIWNYSKFGSDSQDFNILGSFVGFISTIISFLLVYFLLYFSIKSDFDMQRFIRGSMLTLFLMGVFILLPQLTVAAGKNIFLGWANLLDRSILRVGKFPATI